jgi:hypothetical protein
MARRDKDDGLYWEILKISKTLPAVGFAFAGGAAVVAGCL